ncbi:MAG: hypothetical protein AB1656_03560 [Candidatus Omnitrophota bacterium]
MILFFILVFGAAIYLYSLKRLDAPISPGMRTGLLVCRLIFLGLLLFFLMKPQIKETVRTAVSPVLYVALDDSLSMSFPIRPSAQKSGIGVLSRWEILRQNLQEGDLSAIWKRKGFDLKYALFSNAARSLPDESLWTSGFPRSASPAFPFTDLSAAIARFQRISRQDESAYLLLFTDGRWNQGANPIDSADTLFRHAGAGESALGKRIYTFGVGTTETLSDIILEAALAPSNARVGEPLPLQARIAVAGDAPFQPVVVRTRGASLSGEELYFEEKTADLNNEVRKQTLTFDIPPLPPGEYQFTVEAVPIPGEQLASNNMLIRGVRVRKTKDPILLLTSAPDWEMKFLKRSLEDRLTIDLQAYLSHKNGLSSLGDRSWVLERAGKADKNPIAEPAPAAESLADLHLEQWSVVILHNFAFLPDHVDFAKRLRDYVENGGGLLFLPGPLNAASYPPNLRETLPGPLSQIYTAALQSVSIRPPTEPDDPLHSAFLNTEERKIPPLFPFFQTGPPSAAEKILLDGLTSAQEAVSLLVEYRFGLGKIVCSKSNSFWRWNMLTGEDWLSSFWLSVLYQCNPRLLADESQLFTDRSLYEIFEPVQVGYIASSRLRDATISGVPVDVKGPSREETLWLSPAMARSNRFEERYTPVEPGNYLLANRLDGATAEFRVEPNRMETYELRQNVSDLRAMAESSGGEYANSPAWKPLADRLPAASVYREEQRSRFLGEKWWAALSLISLLALEWYMRWLKGLP